MTTNFNLGTDLITSVVSIIFLVATIIGTYKIFEKAGEKGWKALIPGYSGYVQYKLTWKVKYFWMMFGCAVVTAVLYNVSNYFDGLTKLIMLLVALAGAVSCLGFEIGEAQKLSKAYGKSGLFTLGLLFLEPIFKLVLGFGDAEYVK